MAPLVLLLAISGCAKKQGGGFQMPPTPVEVAEVHPQVVRDQFRALGSVESDEIVQIVSEINAIVVSLPFTEGRPVARGAVIARLEAKETAAEAARASAQRELAQSNTQRAQKLYEQEVISQSQLDDLRTGLKVAEANENLARARLAKTVVRAPFSGSLGRRRVSSGSYLKAGDVITELARIDEMRVTFAAPERYLARLKPGSAVSISTPAFPGESFAGKIAVVDPVIDPESRSVQLVARVPNPNHKLHSGMSANVSVTFDERSQALVVPDEAVFAEGTQTFVFVVKPDSTVARTSIVLGLRDSSRVEVTSGLAAGATVVRTGHQKLFDGAKVMPIPDPSLGGPPSGAPASAATKPKAGEPAKAGGK